MKEQLHNLLQKKKKVVLKYSVIVVHGFVQHSAARKKDIPAMLQAYVILQVNYSKDENLWYLVNGY